MKILNYLGRRLLIIPLIATIIFLAGFTIRNDGPVKAETSDEGITWLIHYDGKSLPQDQGWKTLGVPNATIDGDALRVKDESAQEMGSFRMVWKPDPDKEIIVEARARVEKVSVSPENANGITGSATGDEGYRIYWYSKVGTPSGILVSNGKYQDGLVILPDRIQSFWERVYMMDARSDFHTYRLVIRGNDMSIYVDGERRICGEGAFWTPTGSPDPFIQFGSTSKNVMAESYWSYVKLGVRKIKEKPALPKLRITISEPWEIPSTPNDYPFSRPDTRPFLQDMGQGLLLLTVAQGPDGQNEPYGVLKSTDGGRTWSPIPGLQTRSFTPQSKVRLPDNNILGISRMTIKYEREAGTYIGFSYLFDPEANDFNMYESLIRVPEGMGAWMHFNRDIFYMENGEILASVYGHSPASKRGRRSMLLMSRDLGATWTHYSTLGPNPEPSIVKFSDNEMMAVLRTEQLPFEQIWSSDGGKTWTQPITIEEGRVDPDMVYMSNGVVACSYGGPGSFLMFSLDKGKTWEHHHNISDIGGYNYTAIREIRPGRLLYLYDTAVPIDTCPGIPVGGRCGTCSGHPAYLHGTASLRARYVDVERID